MNTTAQTYALLTLTVLLSACGGGGSSGSSSATTSEDPVITIDEPSTTGTPTTVTQSNLQTSSSSDYVVGSAQQQALLLLNNQRGLCGFGLLNQNAALDQATKSHASYLVLNGFTDAHTESNASLPFFTGKTPKIRAIAAGYAFGSLSAQLVTSTDVTASAIEAKRSVQGLLSAPYHLAGMMSGARDVGIALIESADIANAPANRLVFNLLLGTQTGVPQQQGAADQVSTYPCQGVTGTPTGLFNESPSPVADSRNLQTNPVGHPIYVQANLGQTLTVSDFSIKDPAGVAVTAQLTTQATDRHGMLKSNQAFILPLAPLAANTSYQVHVEGLRGLSGSSVPYTVDFSFQTGATNTF
jgi:uncharacterized protein YkwD